MRDSGPLYRAEPAQDRFPADDVLADLPAAAGGEATARILARYAALRHWLLRVQAAPAALTDHARAAARAHLGAVDGWDEGRLLRRLDEASLREAAALLAAAAGEAAGAGDRAGAAALGEAARAAWQLWLREARPGRRPPPG